MTMDRGTFEENILLYGVDLYQWPEERRETGLDSLRKFPEWQALLAEHERFEKVLNSRRYEAPGEEWVQRIITHSLHQEKKSAFRLNTFFFQFLADYFNLPRVALIAVSLLVAAALVTGFAIGFSNSTRSTETQQGQVNLQAFLHYEGNVL